MSGARWTEADARAFVAVIESSPRYEQTVALAQRLAREADRAIAERDQYREALEWIEHQCGVSTVDDAVRAMNEAYETAHNALNNRLRPAVSGHNNARQDLRQGGQDTSSLATAHHPKQARPSETDQTPPRND